jgi:hypothetical protein
MLSLKVGANGMRKMQHGTKGNGLVVPRCNEALRRFV